MKIGNTKIPATVLIGLGVFIALGILSMLMVRNAQRMENQMVTSFEECAAAGYPIMESYPEQCATPDGKSFTRELTPAEKQTMIGE